LRIEVDKACEDEDNFEDVLESDFMKTGTDNPILLKDFDLGGALFFAKGNFYFCGLPWPRAGGGG